MKRWAAAILLLLGVATYVLPATQGSEAVVPETRIGTKATYELALSDERYDGATLAVEWLPPQEILNRYGAPTWTIPLAATLYAPNEREPPFEAIYHLHEGDIIALDIVTRSGTTAANQLGTPAPSWPWIRELRYDDLPQTDCGPTMQIPNPVAIESQTLPCGLLARRVPSGENPSLDLWAVADATFASGIPMPYEWTGELYLNRHMAEPQAVHATMTGYSSGHGRYVDLPPMVVDEPELKPRSTYGPEASGFHHPFPLADAVELALEDSGAIGTLGDGSLAQFMENHPDAYLAGAWYVPTIEPGERTRHLWNILMADGDHRMAKAIYRESTTPNALNVDSPHIDLVDNAFWTNPDLWTPTREQVPDSLPAVEAMAKLHEALQSESVAGASPNGYGFLVRCTTANCTDINVILRVGYEERRSEERYVTGRPIEYPVNPGSLVTDETLVYAQTYFHGDGTIARHIEATREENPLAAAKGLEAMPPPSASAQAPSLPEPGFTTTQAAGVAAMLAAGALFLAPWIKTWVAGFSRIEAHEVLQHPVRRRIADLVETQPGIHFQALVRETQLGRGAVQHHLEKLVRAEQLVEVSGSNKKCYFRKGILDAAVMHAYPFATSPGATAILAALGAEPHHGIRDLARKLGFSAPTVQRHVQRLQSAGAIDIGDDAITITSTGQRLLRLL